jgi:beta-glucosidase
MNKKYKGIIKKLRVEEMVSLLAGVDFWHTAAVPRLGIPAIKVTDGPYGARTLAEGKREVTFPATCFPTGVALASTWDVGLIRKVGEILGDETRERACAVLLGPCVNIHRTPLGGRNFESYSEDPYLSSIIAVAFVQGVQSRGVGVSVKHFALNNQEYERLTISSEASERALREIYLPSFEKAVKEGQAWTVMCSYNRLNGVYASENHRLLTEILKEEWGFKGLVMSDWFATHSTIPAATAGLDLEMPGPPRYFGEELLDAVKNGRVSSAIIEDKVSRLLGVIDKCGALDHPPGQVRINNTASRRKIAREAAAGSFVLLKNENRLLPLKKKKIKTIAVIGPNAAQARIEGGGSSMVVPHYKISPLAGLRQFCGKDTRIRFAQGCMANRLTPLLLAKYLITAREGGKPGLIAETFPSGDLSGDPLVKRIERHWALRWWGDKLPARRLKGENFSMRWSGYFKAALSGSYRFGIVTGGRACIRINGQEVVSTVGLKNAQGAEFSETEMSGRCDLIAGSMATITIEYRPNRHSTSHMQQLRIGCELPLAPDLLSKAVRLAANSDVALVFCGLNQEWESEGFDRQDMDLPTPQNELIREIAAANPRTVVILNNGSPVAMTDWIGKVPAVLEAWFPGQECGHAIADVIFGRINPSGKLPDTFPQKLEDNPAFSNYPGSNGRVYYAEDIFVGYRHYDQLNLEPLFPFGFGLSYTTFEYSSLEIESLPAGDRALFRVKLELGNSGRRTGKEVVQLYIRDLESSLPRPPKELKGFQKVELKPGHKMSLVFDLDFRALAFYNPLKKGWTAEPGEFEVQVGSSSRDIRLKGRFQLK